MAQRLPFLFIAESPIHGRGVFTAQTLQPGDVIEICPVIVLRPQELTLLDDTLLHDYYFLWGPDQDRPAIALGYGSIYNHSCPANANYQFDFADNSIAFFCVRTIAAGDEITVNYNGDPEDSTPVWFQKLEKKSRSAKGKSSQS